MILEFYGQECSHCIRMKPLVKKLEEETGIKVESYEVWHNNENVKKMQEYDKGLCGGVPFFYNTETKGYVCGEAPYESFKKSLG